MVELVDALVEAGEVSPLEIAKARTAVHQAQLETRSSTRALTKIRSQIAETLGVPLAAVIDLSISFRGLDTPSSIETLRKLRSAAAQHRIELIQAIASYDIAQLALEDAVRQQWPDLSIGPGYNLDQGEGKWKLALDFALPVFNQNQGPIAAAQARRETAGAEFLSVQNRVLDEVERAWAHYESVRADLTTIAALQAQLSRQTHLIEALQVAGESSQLEVVQSRIQLMQGTRAAHEARSRVESALGAIENTTQDPLRLPFTPDAPPALRPRTFP